MNVERLVSSYNLAKSLNWSSLSGGTLQAYLIFRYNMPCIARFDVWQEVQEWMSKPQRKPHCSKIETLQNSCIKASFVGMFVLYPKSIFFFDNYEQDFELLLD